MEIVWTRGNDEISFNRPSTWFCLGLRGEGKSSLLEHLAMNYMVEGAVNFDLFGSRDGENLSWLRSPYAKDKKILLLRGENVDVDCSFPVKQVDALTLSDIEANDLIISSSPLYLNIEQEFFNAAKITDLLYKRIHWKRLVYLTIREAANFYYSRLKVSESQVTAKAGMIYLIREGRHVGLTLGLDSIRYYAIDIDIRNLSDYLLLKSQGVLGLDNTLDWLYAYFNPVAVRKMSPAHFIMVSKSGALGLGRFPFHSWHKREKEDILASCGVKVQYGEVLEEAQDRGTFKTVSDKEHRTIVELYVQGTSMREIAERLGRSSRTPLEHIHSHNNSVQRSGFCAVCKRASGAYQNQKVERLKPNQTVAEEG